MRSRALLLALAVLPVSGGVQAFEFDYFGITGSLKSRISTGIAMRMEPQDINLISKQAVPGQKNLCPDTCISINGDPEPNLRLVNAAGAFSGVNADDGVLNYDQYDIVAANNKIAADLSITWKDVLFRVKGVGFYDPLNHQYEERHADDFLQPATSVRPDKLSREFAFGANLLDAYIQYSFEWGGERRAAISIGQQSVRWGESTLVALNSLSEINPPNAALFRMPGVDIGEIFQPVPVILLSTDLFEGLTTEIVYQFGWKPVVPDPRGSFFADNDLIGGDYAMISLGQFGEDPFRRETAHGQYNTIGAVSSTSGTTYLLPANEPPGGGQYGLRLNYFAKDLNDGTEFGLYFLNYHSRFPYAAAFATDDSCARDSLNAAAAVVDCLGFNGTLNPSGLGLEPLPLDTFKAYLDYPEDILMFGASFNTTAFGWSFAGEYSFRPNVPLQVHLTDVIFTALQPALPANTIENDPTGLSANPLADALLGVLGVIPADQAETVARLGTSVFPGADIAVPSFLKAYRGIDRVAANQLILGYERMKVGQFDITGIKAISENPLGADQIIFIGEVGGTMVFDMPDKSVLQFEGGGPNRTHAGPGADGTGDTSINTGRLNPTQQTDGFADEFAWGVRSITRLEYNDVVFGWNFMPTLIAQWDISGIAPFPIQNFVEDRKEFSVGTDINFSESLSGRAVYQIFTGGGRHNTRVDRDNLALSLSYTF
ncbi:MAG: DUF1302 family protein [Pseudomonadota bacterium]